jgi:hypothetical protein
MKVTRLFETTTPENLESIDQATFIELAAKHKALLLQSNNDDEPFSVEQFAEFAHSLNLEHYECKHAVESP